MAAPIVKAFAAAGLLLTAASVSSNPWVYESGDVQSISSVADNTIRDESAQNEVTPRIEFRCDQGGNRITAQIDWGRFISSFSTEVGFKVDDGKFMWLKWKVDSSEKITLSPSADDTQRLLDAMVGGSLLTVDVSPYAEGPVVVTFDLTGFAEARDALQASCG